MRFILIQALAISSVLLSGCANQVAFDKTEDTSTAWPAFGGFTKTVVEVAVIDKRPYVLSGSKSSKFIGISRAELGNGYSITTKSGQPLAKDLTKAVCEGLVNSGVSTQEAPDSIVQNYKASAPGSRALIIAINEWKSDSYTTTSFIYDLTGSLYDDQGRLLASDNVNGKKNVSSGLDGGRQALTDLLAAKGLQQAIVDSK